MELSKQNLSVDGVGFSPEDFITGSQMAGNPGNLTQQPNPFQKSNSTNIPDLHKVDLNSTPQSRQEILEKPGMSTAELKQEILDERIAQDLRSAMTLDTSKGLPLNPKDILKHIIAKGEYQETVELFGHKWTIRALDQRDLLMAAEMVKDELSSSTARMSALIFLQVVFSIEAIEGISVYECFKDVKAADYKQKEDYGLAVRKSLQKYLEHVPPQVINMFYDEYVRIEGKRNKALENLKNS